jgi:hypothetical protein
VNDQDARKRTRGAGWSDEVPSAAAVTVRRVELDILLLNSGILRSYDLCLAEFRAQLIQQHRGGDPAHGEHGGPVQKGPATDVAVDIGVEQNQEFLVEIVWVLRVMGRSWRKRRIG